jgi:hypothetical protein
LKKRSKKLLLTVGVGTGWEKAEANAGFVAFVLDPIAKNVIKPGHDDREDTQRLLFLHETRPKACGHCLSGALWAKVVTD